MTDENSEDREMQERVAAFRLLESKLKGLAQQREILASKIMEVRSTLASVDEIVRNQGDILFPVGSAAYVHGNIKDGKNIVVEIGAGVALEKDVEDARKTLEARLKELEDVFVNLQNEISRVSSVMDEIQSNLELAGA
jgi:prefoldin alpha subunit